MVRVDAPVPPPHRHDIFVKKIFAIRENAEGELRTLLPAELVERADWSSLRLESGSFVDDEMRESHTDLLYSLRIAESPAYVHVLCEHQSKVDRRMLVRFLSYMARIWSRIADQGPAVRLPIVVPLLLHHSTTGWTASTRFADLFDVPADLHDIARRFVPDFTIVVDDLSRTSEFELLHRDMTEMAKLALWVLRAARVGFDAELLPRWAEEASRAGTTASSEALVVFFRYLAEADEGRALLEALLAADVSDDVRRVAMGLRHEWEKEAEARGEARGEERGKAEGRVEIMMKLLRLRFGELPTATVERVRSATAAELDRWAEHVLVASELEQVFS